MRRIEQFHHPGTLEEAASILAQAAGRAAIVAGGTEIVPRPPSPVRALVDITRLGLDRIEVVPDAIEIGACVTLQQIVDSLALNAFLEGVVREAAHQSASRLIRGAATVGGNLVSTNPAWDLVTALLITDATVQIRGSAEVRGVPIDDFLARREEHLAPGNIITRITLPLFGQSTRARFEKLARCTHDAPIVTAVARWSVHEGKLDAVRVAVGGIADRPQRLRLTEAALEGRAAGQEEIELAASLVADQVHAIADVRATAEYRAEMAAVLVRRVLLGALS